MSHHHHHDDSLPLPDYDHLAVGELEHRIRALDAHALQDLVVHERGHGNRAAVLQLLGARLHQLGSGAQPTAGSSAPVGHSDTPHGSRVSPATSPEPRHAPPHGNPAQAGRPKANRG
ncbi:hypothetical protein [Streptacidiphilus monticola]|uniref:DUF8129 domain-containing protein n=1 Tax=Streptacidiphilus monticola TaxID=2161674 RepID=A0ABW1G0C9_9ACTN